MDSLDHSNLQSQNLAITFVFPIIATVAVGLRLFSRSITRTFGLDDWLICAAIVVNWVETYTTCIFIKIGYVGYHLWDIPTTYNAVLSQKYLYATEIAYVPILALIKCSIMCFLLRLTGQKQGVKWAIWALLSVTIIFAIVHSSLLIFQCIPIAAMWDKTIPNAHCLDFSTVLTVFSSFAVVTDAIALMIPTWIVYDLHIHIKQKLMLIGILSFGLITVISGMVRLILLERYTASIPKDPLYTILYSISTIEVGLAFIVACAPSMKPLLRHVLPKVFGSTGFGRTTARSGHLGYELSETPRKGRAQSRTQIEASGTFDAVDLDNMPGNGNGGIIMVKETEIRWHQLKEKSVNNATSTESLV